MGKADKPMRVIVCGGRDFADESAAWNALSRLFDERGEPEIIIHGGAHGADAIAADYAHRNRIRCHAYPANWRKHGKAAGPIRNQQMLAEGKPDLVVAFSGGRGTADMVARARACGVEVVEIAAAIRKGSD